MKFLLLTSVALTALTCQAQATIMQTSTLPTTVFSSPIPDDSTPTVFTGLTGSLANVYRSPFDTVPGSGSAPFTSIEGNGSATFNLSGDVFSLIWGSPDSYNKLELFSGANGKGSVLATITGDLIAPANGTGYSYVTLSNFGTFASIKLDNTAGTSPGTNAFEVSTFGVSSVPLPASLPMFGGALLALAGLAMLKKRGTKASVAA